MVGVTARVSMLKRSIFTAIYLPGSQLIHEATTMRRHECKYQNIGQWEDMRIFVIQNKRILLFQYSSFNKKLGERMRDFARKLRAD
jgi:hypothetical protein